MFDFKLTEDTPKHTARVVCMIQSLLAVDLPD